MQYQLGQPVQRMPKMGKIKYPPLFAVTGLAMVACLLLASVSMSKNTKPALPQRLSSLQDLNPVLDRKDLTSSQKTRILISWLNEERRQPTTSYAGLGGGEVNSGYIQAQIIKSITEVGNPLSLRSVISDKKSDPTIITAARLALGRMGDTTQIPVMINILENHKEPYFRVIAAESLGSLGAKKAIHALERALHNDYSIAGTRQIGGVPKIATVYPLRDAAEIALRALHMPDETINYHVQAKMKQFRIRLEKARKEYHAFNRSVNK